MIAPSVNSIYIFGKLVGAFATIIGSVYSFFRWVFPRVPFVKKVSEINTQVNLLATNHLPHIEAKLDNHSKDFQGLKTDFKVLDEKVEGVSTRIEETKTAVSSLNESFLRHLENTSVEVKRKR